MVTNILCSTPTITIITELTIASLNDLRLWYLQQSYSIGYIINVFFSQYHPHISVAYNIENVEWNMNNFTYYIHSRIPVDK